MSSHDMLHILLGSGISQTPASLITRGIRFTAREAGEAGNSLEVRFSPNIFGSLSVTVTDTSVHIVYNPNQDTLRDIVAQVNAKSSSIMAELAEIGTGGMSVSGGSSVSQSLSGGSGEPSAVASLDIRGITITASEAGEDGNNLGVRFGHLLFSTDVVVRVNGSNLTISFSSGLPPTLQEIVDAINDIDESPFRARLTVPGTEQTRLVDTTNQFTFQKLAGGIGNAGETLFSGDEKGILAENADGSTNPVVVGKIGGGGGNQSTYALASGAEINARGGGSYDNGKFTLDASGVLKFTGQNSGDYEAGDTLTVLIKTTDSQEGINYQAYLIRLKNVDEISVIENIDQSIVVNGGEPLIMTTDHLEISDVDTVSSELIYMITAISSDSLLQSYDRRTDIWIDLSRDDTFSQSDLEAGYIRILATAEGRFALALNSGDAILNIPEFSIILRTPYIPPADVEQLEEIDLQKETDPTWVKTGIGENEIKTGAGDDYIDPGLGDDEVIIGEEGTDDDGHDRVIYRFAETDDGHLVAWDGGDWIKGFTPGEDTLQLGSRSNSVDDIAKFLAKLNIDYKVSLGFEYKGSGDMMALANYDVSAVEIYFAEAVILPGGKLAGSVVIIEFRDPIDWTAFKETWLTGDAFDESMFMFMFKATEDGRAALSNILGLSLEVDASRNVAIGGDGDDTIGIADDSGDWVIYGGEGDDTITLSNGAEEIVYVLADSGSAITATDGADTINTFALGTDSLRFVDSNGDAASLDALLGHMSGVSLIYDGTGYTGVKFALDASDTLTVNFDESLAADHTTITNLLTGATAPSGAGDVTLVTAGLGYIDDLFGDDGISISDTLPPELI